MNTSKNSMLKKAAALLIVLFFIGSSLVSIGGSQDENSGDRGNTFDPLPGGRQGSDDPPTFYEDSGCWYVNPSSYDYDELISWYLHLEQNFSDYLEVFKANEMYGLGTIPDAGYDLYIVRITNESTGFHKPEVLFTLTIHGNEVIPSIGGYWFTDWLMRHAYHPDYDCPQREWLQWLVDNREIYLVTCLNPDGFEGNHRHDANGVDMNRDFDYSRPIPWKTINIETVKRFVNNHTIRTHIDMHTGARGIPYPWSNQNIRTNMWGVSPISGHNYTKYCPPDFYYLDAAYLRLGDYIGNYGGDMNHNNINPWANGPCLGYDADGTSCDFMYGSNVIANPAEDPYVLDEIYGNYPGCGAMSTLIEWGPHNFQDMGNDTNHKYAGEVRRSMLHQIDIAQPYVRWQPGTVNDDASVNISESMTFRWQVNGSLVVDSTQLQWSKNPDPINYPQYSSIENTTYTGQWRGGTGWDNAESGSTNGVTFEESISLDTPGEYYIVAKAKVDQKFKDAILHPEEYGNNSYLRIIHERTNESYYEEINGTDGLEIIEGRLWWYSPIIHVTVSDWWNGQWDYRKKITIHHEQVMSNLTHFPLLIHLNDTDIKQHAQSDGDDIVFISQNGQRYPHEIETYDSTTGELIAWVNISSLSDNIDTNFYMYYGNENAASQQNPVDVWATSYQGIWHLNNDYLDSTRYNNDATNHGSTDTIGWIGDGQYFDGSPDYITAPDHCLGSDHSWTASCWTNSNTSSSNTFHYYLSTGQWDTADAVNIWQNINNPGDLGEMRAQIVDADGESVDLWEYNGSNYNNNQWHLVHITWDATSHNLSIYVNGLLEHSMINTNVDTGSGTSNMLHIGSRTDYALDRALIGSIDEVRISNPVKTPEWITTEYNNQYDPQGFYTISSQETPPGPPLIFSPYPPQDSDNIPINPLLSVQISDVQNDTMNITFKSNSSGNWIDIGSNTSVNNGTYSQQSINMNAYGNKYFWSVHVTDNDTWTNRTFCFTTKENNTPIISNISPANGETDLPISLVQLSFDLKDPEGDKMDYTIQTSPTIGTWDGVNIENSTIIKDITGLNYDTTYTWYVNATDKNGSGKWTNNSYSFRTMAPWWDTTWIYRKSICIDHTQVLSDLIDFPLLVDIIDADLSNHARIDGYDIVFTSSNGSKLAHDIEIYNHTSGHLISWINLPKVSSSEDTIIYMYYGNQGALNQENSEAVWTNNYYGVWHLHEDYLDSTSYNNDGTNFGSRKTSGMIGNGRSFGGDDYITASDHCLGSNHSWTASCWFYSDTTSTNDYHYLFSTGGFQENDAVNIWHYLNSIGELRAQIIDSSGDNIDLWDYSGPNFDDDQWHLLHVTWNETTHALSLFVDGTLIHQIINTDVNEGNGTNYDLYLGARNDLNTERMLIGDLDEIRITNTSYESHWIATEYNNQKNPNVFYDLGTEQTSKIPDAPVIINEHPSNESIDIELNPSLSVFVFDYQNNSMNIEFLTNATGEWTVIETYSDVGNGSYQANPTDMNCFGTTYFWYVNATDTHSGNWTNHTFHFTTIVNQTPLISDVNPADAASDIPISLSELSFSLTDSENDLMDYSVVTVPDIGTATGSDVNNGVVTVDINGLTNSTMYTWFVNVTDPLGSDEWNNQTFTFTTEIEPGVWWNDHWLHRKKITINHSMVDESLTHFPLLISLDADADLASYAQNDGDDVVFTTYHGEQLAHEIEHFDGGSGKLIAWVNISNFPSVSDTILYLYYGNYGSSNQQNPGGVWDASYQGVWHFHDDFDDSTSYGNDGTNHGSTDTLGMIGDGQYFDGDDYINASDHCLGAENSWTASCWFNSNQYSSMIYHYLMSTGDFDAASAVNLYHNINHDSYPPIGELRTKMSDQNNDFIQLYDYSGTAPKGNWHLVHLVWNADSHTYSIYVNGSIVNQSTDTSVDTGEGTSQSLLLGARADFDQDRYHIGEMDEVRVSNPMKNDSWIMTEYRNQGDPNSFYEVGLDEIGGNPPDEPLIADESPLDQSSDIGLSPVLSVNVVDSQEDSMDIFFTSNASGMWETLETYNSVGDGVYTCDNTSEMDGFLETYWWSVNATDSGSGNWTNISFCFTTRPENYLPIISNPSPSVGETEVDFNPLLSVMVSDWDNESLNVTFYTNATGPWRQLGSYQVDGNGTVNEQTFNMTALGQTYWWRVNVSDGGGWCNETHYFSTITDVLSLKWSVDIGGGAKGSPCVVNVSGDATPEVIAASSGGVKCLDSVTGDVLWSRSYGGMGNWVQHEVADLNNDGIAEVLVPLQSGPPGLLVLHGNNGSIYWVRRDLGGDYSYCNPITFDLDGDGYPTVFFASTEVDQGMNGTGRITALTYDGQKLYDTFAWRPCAGGLALADYDYDGRFEIYMNDRSQSPGGMGLRSFWADDLNCRWNQTGTATISSHMTILDDVTGDGLLDCIVTPQTTTGGVMVVSAADGHIIRGTTNMDIPAHEQFTVYDIDHDGNLESLHAENVHSGMPKDIVVWDLVDWSRDATIDIPTTCYWPPIAADVTGDGLFDIVAGGNGRLMVYNHTFDFIDQFTGTENLQQPMVHDIDADGFNEIVVIGQGGRVYAFDTPALLQGQAPRDVKHYSEYRRNAAEYVERPGPKHPMQRDISPANDSMFVNPDPVLSAHCWDYQWDRFNVTFRTNASGSWEDIVSYHDIGRYPDETSSGLAWGTYNATPVGMDQPKTRYYWSISAEDCKGNSVERVFHFTTADVAPYVSSPYPVNNDVGVLLNQSVLQFNLTDYQGDVMNWSVETVPDIGSGEGVNVSDGQYSVPVSGLLFNTSYTWFVNVSDGSYWTNESFCFTTRPGPGVWWSNEWAFRKEILVDNSMVVGSHVDFPLLIKIESDGDLVDGAQDDFDDVVFTDYNGNKLDHEIEWFDPGDGSLLAWVRVPSLSVDDLTILYVYYGNPSCSSMQDPAGTWRSEYRLVQHLNETGGVHSDSSSYENDGAAVGGVMMDAVGLVDGGDMFDGVDDSVDVGDDASLNVQDSVSVSAWVKVSSSEDSTVAVLERGSWSMGNYGLYTTTSWNGERSCFQIYDLPEDVDDELTGSDLRDDTWHYLVGTWDGSVISLYEDGTLVDSLSNAVGSIGSSTSSVMIGNRVSSDRWLNGSLDEVRVFHGGLSGEWIQTEYRNMVDPGGFYVVGDEETGAPVVSGVQPVDGSVGVEFNPVLSVQVVDPEGALMDVVFRSNVSGSWTTLGSNLSVGDGVYQQSGVDMDEYLAVYYWSVNVSDGVFWTNETFVFTTEGAGGLWWNSDWSFRKELVIDHGLVGDSLVDFPVLINLENDSDIMDHVQGDGDDVVFTDYEGNVLDHEIEVFNSSTGNLTAWVRVPFLSGVVNTSLYVYYGNGDCENQENPSGVWSADYEGVWHVHDDFGDSTGFGNDAVNYGSIDAVGVIGDGQFFGGDDYVTATSHCLGAGNSWTASTWVLSNTSSSQDFHYLMSTGNYDANNAVNIWQTVSVSPNGEMRAQILDSTGDEIEFGNYGGGIYTDKNWHLLHVTWNAITHNYSLYIDGLLETSIINSNVDSGSGTTNDLHIGSRTDLNNLRFLVGYLDEVRISNPVKNSSWIWTEYQNQFDPGDFVAVGVEENVPVVNDTVVSVFPSSQNVSVGESFVVSVFCDPVVPIEGFEFDLDFNASLIQADSVSEGDIFGGHSTFFDSGSIDNSVGYIDNVFGLITDEGNVTTSGYCANISFTALSTVGVSDLLLLDVGVTNDSAYVAVDVVNGSVVVESLGDSVPPVISDVGVRMSDPLDTSIGWENVSCVVTDDVAVDQVWLNLSYPDLHSENVSMIKSGDTFYYNVTLTDEGTYSFFIWANDTSDNRNSSVVDVFELPPNWDINIDHQCSIVDLIQVSNHFDETGDSGWIREDVDNNGDVSIVDLVQIANHFDETW